ncbi:MAG: hypothetical protein KIS89_00780 [Dokdonella sp.]|nr:hypothetical protein [Dokdonella sp.]
MSRLRICASVLFGIGLLTLGVVVLGETLGPYGERKAQRWRGAFRRRVALAKGVLWAREAKRDRRAARHSGGSGRVELDGVRVFG